MTTSLERWIPFLKEMLELAEETNFARLFFVVRLAELSKN
jgi:hypothetical protein